MKVSLKSMSIAVCFIGLSACAKPSTSSSSKSRELTKEEKLLDMDVAFNNFRQYYAPLQYKTKLLKTDYEAVFSSLREEAALTKSDQEFFDVMGKLVDSFKDGHVGVKYPGLDTYSLPFTLDYFEGHYVIESIEPEFAALSGAKIGDDLLAIDGVPTRAIADELLKFGSIGYDKADERVAADRITKRRFSVPKSIQTSLDFRRESDGAIFNVPTYWIKTPGVAAKSTGVASLSEGLVSEMAETSVRLFGAKEPFFNTPKVQENFGLVKVSLSLEEWLADGQTGAPFDVFAALYRHSGKNILLLRIPSYSANEVERVRNVKTYELILKKYSALADVLVLDQTHNPGGSVAYVEELARLFYKQPGPGFGFKPRADRLWLEDINQQMLESGTSPSWLHTLKSIYSLLNAANEAGEFLGPQISLTGQTTTLVENTAWNKPVLLLIDELCGSGGDAFPMLMKGNKAATLFGHRTSGLGGNVEVLPALPNSQAVFRMTRSFFYLATPDGKLEEKAIIENNGVTPDIERTYGYEDFKDQFSSYVNDFSAAAVNLVK